MAKVTVGCVSKELMRDVTASLFRALDHSIEEFLFTDFDASLSDQILGGLCHTGVENVDDVLMLDFRIGNVSG